MTALHDLDVDALLGEPGLAADPYPAYAQLREQAPVAWSDTWGCWLLTRYDDVHATIRQPGTFGNAGRLTSFVDQLPAHDRDGLDALYENFSVGLLSADPPDHRRLRSLVSSVFTPRAVQRMRDRIQEITDDLLDAVVAHGEMDVVGDLAYPLPSIVISEMLGVPAEDRDDFKRWTVDVNAFQGTGAVDAAATRQANDSIRATRAWLSRVVADRRDNPTDDLISELARAEQDGERLTEGELLSTCLSLVVAGNDTTTSLIGSAVSLLLEHPEQLGAVRQDPDLVTSLIEEVVRYESPLQYNPRVAREDVQLRGQTIRAGDRVLQMLGSANRDVEHFETPDRFDVRRDPNPHVGFGGGVHFCLGAPLARLEAEVALTTFLRRVDDLQLSGDDRPRWRDELFLRGLEHLRVTFSPRSPDAASAVDPRSG